MTIYTDQVTGKQYDRVPGGVTDGKGPTEGYRACRECAFNDAMKECARAVEHCVSRAAGKTVFFVFKERKALTHDGAYLIVIPMSCWHKAANDDHYAPLQSA